MLCATEVGAAPEATDGARTGRVVCCVLGGVARGCGGGAVTEGMGEEEGKGGRGCAGDDAGGDTAGRVVCCVLCVVGGERLDHLGGSLATLVGVVVSLGMGESRSVRNPPHVSFPMTLTHLPL